VASVLEEEARADTRHANEGWMRAADQPTPTAPAWREAVSSARTARQLAETIPQSYSFALQESADGSVVVDAIPDDAVDETQEEDGIYLFLPEHGLPAITRTALGDCWLPLGRALRAAMVAASLANRHSGANVDEASPTGSALDASDTAKEMATVNGRLVLAFLGDLERTVRSFDYDQLQESRGGRRRRARNRLLAVMEQHAAADWDEAVEAVSILRAHIRSEASTIARLADAGPASESVATVELMSGSMSVEASFAATSPDASPRASAADNYPNAERVDVPVSMLDGSELQLLMLLHFVRLTLLVDPTDRPTASELLLHPFISSSTIDEVPLWQ
jgi:hypothetical protein